MHEKSFLGRLFGRGEGEDVPPDVEIERSPEKRDKGEAEVGPEAAEAKFGRNVKAVLEFMRHETPGKITEGPKAGMSADFLTPEGQERARAKGPAITEPAVKDYASPKMRAQETVDLGLQNADEDVRVINQRLKCEAREASVGQRQENEFLIRTKPELDTAKNFEKIMAPAKAWAEAEIANGGKRSLYDLIVQYYLDHPEQSAELGTTTPQEAAEEIAARAGREIGMTERFYSGSNVRLRNATHGPKLEPFLQRVMIVDGQTGFKDLTEIGGVLNPGEGFELAVDRKGKGDENVNVRIRFRGQEYDIDIAELERLADAYEQRLEAAKKKE